MAMKRLLMRLFSHTWWINWPLTLTERVMFPSPGFHSRQICRPPLPSEKYIFWKSQFFLEFHGLTPFASCQDFSSTQLLSKVLASSWLTSLPSKYHDWWRLKICKIRNHTRKATNRTKRSNGDKWHPLFVALCIRNSTGQMYCFFLLVKLIQAW